MDNSPVAHSGKNGAGCHLYFNNTDGISFHLRDLARQHRYGDDGRLLQRAMDAVAFHNADDANRGSKLHSQLHTTL